MKRNASFDSIGLLFGLHSITSLAYEILWIKILETRLGMSTSALGTVLAVFILGLGVGSLLSTALGRQWGLGVRWRVAGAELGLGLWSALLPLTLKGLDLFYTHWAPSTETPMHHLIRAAIAMALLFPSAALMGTVFPLLSEKVEKSISATPGGQVSRLYQNGLFSSALGCIVLPPLLIRLFGLMGSNEVLAMLSVGTAIWAAMLLPTTPPDPVVSSAAPSETRAASLKALCGVSFLLGAALFIVEIVGGHFVWLQVNDTFYANGILVSMVLGMMGLGAWFFSFTRRSQQSLRWSIVWGLLFFALAVVLWMLSPYPIVQVFGAIAKGPLFPIPGARFFLSTSVLVLLILGGPAAASGFIFPALCAWALSESVRASSAVGRLTGWNYLGSMAGALAATFVLIPYFGMTPAVVTAALLSTLAVAVLILDGTDDKVLRSGALAGAGLFAGFCLWLSRTTDITFPDRQGGVRQQILFHHEDASSIVEVFEDVETGDHFLYSNRLRMEGSNAPGENVRKAFQGALPVLLHPAPRQVLVVGLGTGASLASNLRPEVDHLTCVEYAPGIPQAAALFEQENRRVLSNPRVTLVHQDGRNFIKLSRLRYDVIIQDLFFPYQTGVGNLYTQEHFQTVLAHLNPHGRFAQWIPLHQIGPDELKSLIRTFQSVFPSTTLWLSGRFLLMYGGQEPLRVPWPAFKNRLEGDAAIPETDPYDFINFYVADQHTLAPRVASAPLNTDDNLLIEIKTPLLFEQLDKGETGFRNARMVAEWSQPVTPILDGASAPDLQRIQKDREARLLYFESMDQRFQGNVQGAFQTLQTAHQGDPANYEIRNALADLLLDRIEGEFLQKHWTQAESLLRQTLSYSPFNRRALFLLAEIYYEQDRRQESLQLFEKLNTLYPDYFQARMSWGERLAAMKRDREAAEQFLRVAERLPHSVESRFDLANCLLKLGKVHEAAALYAGVLRLDKTHQGAREILNSLQPPTRN